VRFARWAGYVRNLKKRSKIFFFYKPYIKVKRYYLLYNLDLAKNSNCLCRLRRLQHYQFSLLNDSTATSTVFEKLLQLGSVSEIGKSVPARKLNL
jgi:hypothetical protein